MVIAVGVGVGWMERVRVRKKTRCSVPLLTHLEEADDGKAVELLLQRPFVVQGVVQGVLRWRREVQGKGKKNPHQEAHAPVRSLNNQSAGTPAQMMRCTHPIPSHRSLSLPRERERKPRTSEATTASTDSSMHFMYARATCRTQRCMLSR